MNEIIANKQAHRGDERYFDLDSTNQNPSPQAGVSYQRIKLRRMPSIRNKLSTSIYISSVGDHGSVANIALNAAVTLTNSIPSGRVRVAGLARTTIQCGFSLQIREVVR
jgi:hypothetical protein